MKRNLFENKINSIIRECIEENRMRSYVRNIISEEAHKLLRRKINEAENSNAGDVKRKTVMNMLHDDKFDHAYLAYQLWHPKDDSEKDIYRSLFSKKATGKPDNDGAVRHFTDEEITKLYELLRAK